MAYDGFIQDSCFNVSLRPLAISDHFLIKRWLTDPYIASLTFVVPGPEYREIAKMSDQILDTYIESLIYDLNRTSFAILVNGKHVGNVGLKNCNLSEKYAECFIEVGESGFRGLGVGSAALTMVHEYAFSQLGLEQIRLEVLEHNDPALHVYEKLGYQHTQRTGWHFTEDGHYKQVLGMVLTRRDWFLRKLVVQFPSYIKLMSFTKFWKSWIDLGQQAA